jgi:O-antigen ligase
MLFAVGVAIVVLGSLATLASPFLGLLIYWAWVVVRPQEVWPGLGGGVIPLEKILALTLLASLLFRGKLRPLRDLDSGRAALALGAFLAVNYLSVLMSLEPGNSLFMANEFAKTVVFFVCIITLIDDEVGLRKSLWVYALAIGWTAASSIWNYEVHPYFRQGIQRATGLTDTGGDPNAIATTLVLALPIVLVLFGAARKMGRVLLLAIFSAALVCIVVTGSRMGFILLLLVLILTAARSQRGKILVPGILVLLVIGWLAMPTEYQERYKTILPFVEDPLHEGKTGGEESAHGRIAGFEVAWQMFTDRPVLGVGAGNFPWAWRSPTTPYNYRGLKAWFQPHNLPGKLLSELGLLGLLSFGGYVLAVWRELRAARLELRAAADGSPLLSGLATALSTQLIVLLVGGLSGHNLYRVDWYVAGALAIVVCRLATRPVTAEAEAPEGVSQVVVT